jgi:hypothetical protein
MYNHEVFGKEAMKALLQFITVGAGLCLAGTAFALQAPADAPAGSTGLCKDGTYYAGDTKKGACKGHKGVKDWYGSSTDAAAPAAKAAAPAASMPAAPAAAATAATATAAAPAAATSAKKSMAMPTTAAPGGGPGLVWVNTSSKVYHCQSDKWYGKTKAGEYMSEADAKAKGNHAEHGKACS